MVYWLPWPLAVLCLLMASLHLVDYRRTRKLMALVGVILEVILAALLVYLGLESRP